MKPIAASVSSMVLAGGPADRAGIERGDLLPHFDDNPVHYLAMLKALLNSCGPGRSVQIRREGDGRAIRLALGSRAAAFDTQWLRPSDADAAPVVGLTPPHRKRLQESLMPRFCPCPCGRRLSNCFGCSTAKSEFTEAERLVRLGLSVREVQLALDPPVILVVMVRLYRQQGSRGPAEEGQGRLRLDIEVAGARMDARTSNLFHTTVAVRVFGRAIRQ